jgi:uncharacterized phage protein (TIGR01671 family)
MREIKFRAWHKEMRYMSPVGQLNEMKSVLIYVPEQTDGDGNVDWNGGIVEMEKVELMQYTGLKDKNGKEIYEGDIVKYPLLSGCCGYQETIIVAEFVGGNYNFILGCPFDIKMIEIIGNIYEGLYSGDKTDLLTNK